jgi:DNA-binding ferritin-like protein
MNIEEVRTEAEIEELNEMVADYQKASMAMHNNTEFAFVAYHVKSKKRATLLAMMINNLRELLIDKADAIFDDMGKALKENGDGTFSFGVSFGSSIKEIRRVESKLSWSVRHTAEAVAEIGDETQDMFEGEAES